MSPEHNRNVEDLDVTPLTFCLHGEVSLTKLDHRAFLSHHFNTLICNLSFAKRCQRPNEGKLPSSNAQVMGLSLLALKGPLTTTTPAAASLDADGRVAARPRQKSHPVRTGCST